MVNVTLLPETLSKHRIALAEVKAELERLKPHIFTITLQDEGSVPCLPYMTDKRVHGHDYPILIFTSRKNGGKKRTLYVGRCAQRQNTAYARLYSTEKYLILSRRKEALEAFIEELEGYLNAGDKFLRGDLLKTPAQRHKSLGHRPGAQMPLI